MMRTIDIFGDNYAGYTAHERKASRCVMLDGDRVLLVHETVNDLWMLPGGGFEGDETPEACCIREAAEETGLTVAPERCFLLLNEHYEDWRYVSYYFLCRCTGQTARRLTAREASAGLAPEWVSIADALAIFAQHETLTAADEERRGIYQREYTALRRLIMNYELGIMN